MARLYHEMLVSAELLLLLPFVATLATASNGRALLSSPEGAPKVQTEAERLPSAHASGSRSSGAKPCYFDLQCSQCNSDATRCLECWDGFHVAADGKCTPSNGCADPRCMECTPSEDQCKSCRDAFEMLRTIVPHWSSFDQRYPSGMQQLLNSSFPLYLGEDGWCHECTAHPLSTGCGACDATGQRCTGCLKAGKIEPEGADMLVIAYSGAYHAVPVDGSCIYCGENCQSCGPDGVCTECANWHGDGWYEPFGLAANKTCLPCVDPYCSDCGKDHRQCSECYSDIWAGWGKNQSGLCAPCAADNCIACDSDYRNCTYCSTTYEVVGEDDFVICTDIDTALGRSPAGGRAGQGGPSPAPSPASSMPWDAPESLVQGAPEPQQGALWE
ncbi:hypothetical protein CHLNCDRAFT_141348 [Chlorella variabilis]|uniref:Uncharacterized protein n=1 Tax=Chlorella variabilis TaxID=554065 RepID=E1ZSP3_CHLVA|nr:hypothetical protein CHLNCDRAFT_141348 [Chlorella variabilis]EFN51140.1 hypothetical protein CHLNCDRAFT_141348 [Chlorella variabilis]|eukprot:XP_005843242.1 hypothetical protein CHLNCDRAFT_141348 [Chlorella variabilis]